MSFVKGVSKRPNARVLIAGDFNCDLTDSSSPRIQLLLNSLSPSYSVADKTETFTFIGVLSATSNLDYFIASFPCETVEVICDGFYSDHLPIKLKINASFHAPKQPDKKWFYIKDWKEVNREMFRFECDRILNKIKAPFHLLCTHSGLSEKEIAIGLTTYLAEINHALKCAEASAVPCKRIRKGSQVQGWSKNPSLISACESSKIWLNIWRDCGRPKSGTINGLRLRSKRFFAKVLRKHKVDLIEKNAHKIAENPTKLWKKFKRPCEHISANNIPEPEWINYYKYEFSSPDPALESKFDKELSACLKKHKPSTFIIKPSDISFYCQKLKKRNSAVDGIAARHFDYASALLLNHLSLLFQMSIENRVVPYQFTVGQITPIPKKGKKDFASCDSFRPITVSCTIFKLFESVILDEIVSKCYVPPHQFGYQKGISREHALFALMNVLADAERSRSHIILCALDVARAFDSCIFSQVLFEAYKRGVNLCIVKCLLYMYHHIKAKLKRDLPFLIF